MYVAKRWNSYGFAIPLPMIYMQYAYNLPLWPPVFIKMMCVICYAPALSLILAAFLKSGTSRPVGWTAHKCVGKSAHGCERLVLKREIRVGGQVQPGVGGKLLQLLPHPHALRSV
jgi:hypothetical protein